MLDLYAQYRSLRMKGDTPTSSAKTIGASNSHKLERKLAKELGPEAYSLIQTVNSRKAQQGRDSISYTTSNTPLPIGLLSRIEKGALAEDLAFYKMRRFGLDAYRPLHPARYDFVVMRGSLAIKIQVKSTCSVKP